MLNMEFVEKLLKDVQYCVEMELYPFEGKFDINDTICFCNLTRACLRDKLLAGGVTTTLPHTINNQ